MKITQQQMSLQIGVDKFPLIDIITHRAFPATIAEPKESTLSYLAYLTSKNTCLGMIE